MITWSDLIARLINFMLEKVLGKQIELTMDDRRKAARQFLSLYHSVSDLEVLSKEIVAEMRYMSTANDPTIISEWLDNISCTVDETSQRFLESTQGLRSVLQIFDPVLADTLSALEANKFSFLLEAATGFKAHKDKESQEIEYTYPVVKPGEEVLVQSYEWHSNHFPIDTTRPIEWPDGVLLNFVDPDDVKTGRVRLKDPDSVLQFANLLEQHAQCLADARTALADFLRQRFNIEDLLALKMPATTFDRIHAMHRTSDAVGISYLRWFGGQPIRKFPIPSQVNEEEKK